MGIPKVIHYCWFGGKPLPEDVLRCMESWKKYCPDYQIKRWDESNSDFSQCLYAQQALDAKKWAFASDYARLKAVYDEGGIYLDTDVELVRPLDDLLDLPGYIGMEESGRYFVNTGLGFGAEKGNSVVSALMQDYISASLYTEDGRIDSLPCPYRNTAVMEKLGLERVNKRQHIRDMEVFPSEYFAPTAHLTGKLNRTENTYSIHHYHGSWIEPEPKWKTQMKRLFGEERCIRAVHSVRKVRAALRRLLRGDRTCSRFIWGGG